MPVVFAEVNETLAQAMGKLQFSFSCFFGELSDPPTEAFVFNRVRKLLIFFIDP